ncbi:MAG: hypothetical protein VKJ04_04235 [Vampirovibrionales bacterium]|nr:hypothetical protein [Vampirovibrionales bacterium]
MNNTWVALPGIHYYYTIVVYIQDNKVIAADGIDKEFTAEKIAKWKDSGKPPSKAQIAYIAYLEKRHINVQELFEAIYLQKGLTDIKSQIPIQDYEDDIYSLE